MSLHGLGFQGHCTWFQFGDWSLISGGGHKMGIEGWRATEALPLPKNRGGDNKFWNEFVN